MNLLAGVHAPSAGEILIDGAAVRFASPAEARAAGVAAVYQELAVLPELSVAENIWLGREPRTRAGLLDRRALQADTTRLLEAYRLPLDAAAVAGTLSVAARQLVEIARALSSSARILTLDEPTAVLSAEERARLFDTVAELKRRGLLVLFVSHRLDEVFEIADRVTVLRNGRRVFAAATADVTRAELVRHMVGHDVDDRTRAAPLAPSGAPPLTIRVHAPPAPFELRLERGEIVGLGGLVGSGRTRLARRLAGLEGRARRLPDRRAALQRAHAGQAVARGIVYLTEDRKRDGLFAGLSVLRNASAADARQPVEAGLRRRPRRAAPGRADARAPEAGGGVAAHAGSRPERRQPAEGAVRPRPAGPTAAADLRRADARRRRRRARGDLCRDRRASKQGVTIVLVSSDLKELLSLCHRILVVRDAAVVAELPASASELEIVDAAVVRAPAAVA